MSRAEAPIAEAPAALRENAPALPRDDPVRDGPVRDGLVPGETVRGDPVRGVAADRDAAARREVAPDLEGLRARDVFAAFTDFVAFFALPVVAREDFLFGAAFLVRARDEAAARLRFGAALRAVDRRAFVLPRDAPRALPFRPADDRELFREPPRPAFFAFFATLNLPVDRYPPGAGSYNSGFVEASRRPRRTWPLSASGMNASGPRVLISAVPGGLTVEVRPLVRSAAWRRRLTIGALLVAAAALFGAARLVPLWESSLRRGSFSDLPLALLLFLSVAVGISTPLTLLGLAALAFSEERVEVGASEVVISTTAFERTRVRRISLDELECWRETWVPLPPWWTWSVKRLAARSGGRLYPVAGGAGPREKKAIAIALARATRRPLIADFGRVVVPGNS